VSHWWAVAVRYRRHALPLALELIAPGLSISFVTFCMPGVWLLFAAEIGVHHACFAVEPALEVEGE
jgi:hypothetical protein